jgi:hypothetical protein
MVKPIELDDDLVKDLAKDDSSQDPAQPAVGPAIQFDKLIVPDDEPVTDDNEYGEVLETEGS